ncbi:nucleotidyltransferase domain-containing protein [Candidatus Bathyarchaeota archaeon]|nr:nucleotidyltransferase domain-containing protein [Candidatus Bathyarchaeota archaeon]
MTRLPERIRKTLEKIIADLQVKENIYGVGLFGSWSRGEAVASSDIDLLILDKADFGYEYVERVKVNGLFLDLNHVPKRWLCGVIPPEIDQKLYEMQILYDRDWSLNNVKLLMAKSYSSPERVDIRTEAHIVESDIYLSRATSAYSRDDLWSAQLFTTIALETILKVLIEIALEPFSSSRFVERLEVSAVTLGLRDLFDDYLDVTGLERTDGESVKEKLRLFNLVWHEMKEITEQNPRALVSLHFKVRTKLNYYLNPTFLQGMAMRINALIDWEKVAEASHYIESIFLDMVENYVWLKSLIAKLRVDYSTLMRSLEYLEMRSPKNFDYIVEFLGLSELDKFGVNKFIEKTRGIMFRVRGERKVLIKKHLIKS